MAEALVSSILQQLAELAIESATLEFKLLRGAEGAIKKVQRNLSAIHALLEDAEEKQVQEKSIKLWLNNVKEASYELEDILDEWNYNTAFQKSKPLSRKVLSFILCGHFRRVHNIVVKINNVNEELDEIAREKDKYGLVRREIRQPQPIRLESTSFTDVSLLHGRDEVKNKIVSTLLSGNDQNGILTISIVGMGGIGKTALAQLIYNDNHVVSHFSKKIWVCVSDCFDQYKIARAILEKLDPTSTSLLSSISVQGVLEKVCEKIRNEKFFLVLDDVWTERDEHWESFKTVFRQGKSGSRVLVTTRKESVAETMESFGVFDLKLLSDEVCWLILRQSAFSGKDRDLCETLEEVGKEIAKKCKGLPLAAKTLGGLLRWKRSKSEWENVLNSELWKLNLAQKDIFTPLLLSYYDLSPAIRQCLVYCVIFPKDYEMIKYELIVRWTAQGYLRWGDNAEMEMHVGEEYFNCLASRSLFQDFQKDSHGNIETCKMHDIVYDFVKFLVGDEILVEDNATMLDLSSLKTRHVNVSIGPAGGFLFPANGMEKLRTCMINIGRQGSLINHVLGNLVKRAEYLRLFVVSGELNGTIFNLKVPENIKKLLHLRVVSFGSNGLIRLPEGVCDLLNLQVLDVSYCSNLRALPDGIGKLINLRHLDTSFCANLNHYPKGIAKLTRLRQLPFVKATTSNDPKQFSFGDFENLDLLEGEVEVELKGNILDAREAKRAKLHNKLHLPRLEIRTNSRHSNEAAEACLAALTPPPHPQISCNIN